MKQYKGISAHFIRSFLLALDPQEPIPLRAAQTEAMEKAQCSLQTAKKLARDLSAHSYIVKEKVGRSFLVTLTPEGQDFLTWILETDFGATPDLPTPNFVIDPHAGVVLTSHIPRAEWSQTMRQVKEHGLITAFLPANATNLTFTTATGEIVHVPSL